MTPSWNRALGQSLRVLRSGQLPERYGPGGADPFFEAFYRPFLRPDMQILDVGGGRKPVIPLQARPARCRYVGLDVSVLELRRAPTGAYDEFVVADAAEHVPALERRFELVVSYQVLEHVRPLDEALKNFRTYLRPGGHLVAQLSGGYSAFAIASRVVPRRLVEPVLRILAGRAEETVFPTRYDRCSRDKLREMLSVWTNAEVVARYEGAGYFRFARLLQAAYVGYEELTIARPNLATHYVISATR